MDSFVHQEKLVHGVIMTSHQYPEVLAQKNMMLMVDIFSSLVLGPLLNFLFFFNMYMFIHEILI